MLDLFSSPTRIFLLLCFALFICSCASSRTPPESAPSSSSFTHYSSANCLKPQWSYTATVPAQWKPLPGAGCDVQFQDGARPSQTSNPDQQHESEFLAGGIGIRGPILSSRTGADAEQSWMSMQPNHTSIVTWQPITTPLGPGRVYTLDCDRSETTWSSSNPTWRGQFAYIPQGDFSYEIWVHAESTTKGTIEPTLAQVLATLAHQ